LALTYLLNFPVPLILYQSPSFVPYIITSLSLFFFLFLPPLIRNFLFSQKDIKGRCDCVSGNKKDRNVENIFFFFFLRSPFSYEKLCIYIHILQYQCNPSLNCNEQYKEEIGHDSSTLRKSNHNKL